MTSFLNLQSLLMCINLMHVKWIKTTMWNMLLCLDIIKSNVLEKPHIYHWAKAILCISNNLMEKGLHNHVLGILDTFTVLLIWFVLAVCIAITSEGTVNTLPTGTLELGFGAYRTIELVTVVLTLSEPITAPSHRDAVNLSSETSKLLRRTCWRFFKWTRGRGVTETQ